MILGVTIYQAGIGICMKIHRAHATPSTVCSLIGGTPVFIYPTRDIYMYIYVCVCMSIREKFSRLNSNETFTISSADYVARFWYRFRSSRGSLKCSRRESVFCRYLFNAYRAVCRTRGDERTKEEESNWGNGWKGRMRKFLSIFFFFLGGGITCIIIRVYY